MWSCLIVQSSKNRDDTTASVIPVRMRAGTVALESSFRGGIKRELLRSLCQVSLNASHVFSEPLACPWVHPQLFTMVIRGKLCKPLEKFESSKLEKGAPYSQRGPFK